MTSIEDPLAGDATVRAKVASAEESARHAAAALPGTETGADDWKPRNAEALWNQALAVQPSLGSLCGGELHLDSSPGSTDPRMRREDLLSLANELGDQPDEASLVEFVVNINAWGYGLSGYAKYRTDAVINGDRVRFADSARRALAILNAHGPVAAYYFLLNNSAGHVSGWGPAFFTKFLYFADARNQPESKEAGALILDQIMDGQVRELVGDPAGRPGLGKFRRGAWTTGEYAFYVALLGHIGKARKLRADRVEAVLFARGRAAKSREKKARG